MGAAKQTIYDVVVIGGGASGMMAAIRAAERGKRVLLLEKNAELGKKLKISGGGRCNVTNAEEDVHQLLPKYGAAEKFLYSPFSQFGVKDTFAFFESRGLPLVVEAHKRAFPKTQRALDVHNVLERAMIEKGVTIRTNATVTKLRTKDGQIESVVLEKEVVCASSFVLATGGTSHPETGSTGDGFAWLSELGLSVQKPTPSLVPIAVKEKWVKSLSGLAIDAVRVTFFVDGLRAFAAKGRILFTHFGLSGPTILNSASKIADLLHEGEVTALMDIFPGQDHGAIDDLLIALFEETKNKQIGNALALFVPTGMSETILTLWKMDPETKVHSVKKEDRKKLVQLLKSLPMTVTGLMGEDMAIVSDGGLSLSELDLKTMRVKHYGNLYVTGDLLNIRRPSGGFSLQLCWTTGFIAGDHC